MLLDKPLALVRRGESMAQDVVGYIDWLGDEDRAFMPKDDVIEFVTERLDWSCASDDEVQKTQESENRSSGISKKRKVSDSNGSLKGRARGKLIGFWRDGDASAFQHINAAILVTLRFLHAEGLSEENAVSVVSNYVDNLPNLEISSRQGTRVSEIYAEVRRCVKRVWSSSASSKLITVVEHWQSTGFLTSDQSTWSSVSSNRTVINCPEITFDDTERMLVIKEMAPLLVGRNQAEKSEKQDEVIRAVGHFLRFVRCHSGEIDMRWLPTILEDFHLKVATTQKQCRFFALLRKWNWICVLRAPIPRRFSRNRIGKATVYGIGKAMQHKFGITAPSPSPNNKQQINILSSTFQEVDEEAIGIRSIEVQLTGGRTHDAVESEGQVTLTLPSG